MKLILAIVILFIAGCRIGPHYDLPEDCVPEEWKSCYEPTSPAPCFDNWWEVFQDSILNNLECQALANSPQIDIAIEKVIEARALAQVSGSSLYPQINLNPVYTNTGELFKIFIPPGLIPGGLGNASVFRIHQLQYFLPLTMNYEIDLWGKLQSQYESATYSAESSEWDFISILLTLTSDLASNYFQLRSLDSQIHVLADTLELRKKTLQLAKVRHSQGLVSYQDVASAEVQHFSAEASYFDARRQRILLENAIATLIGIPSSEFCLEAFLLTLPPPEIPSGIPSDILLQRPDIAEAERKAAAEHVLIGAAYASFFPSLSLTGSAGYLSPDLRQFMTWKSRYWQLGANSSENVIDGGRKCGNLETAWARFYRASAMYQQQILIAFQEVENALNNLTFQSQQYQSLKQAVQAAEKSAEISRHRYAQGLVSYLEVVSSERNRLDADLSLINSLSARYVSTIQLIKALGGCWRCDVP